MGFTFVSTHEMQQQMIWNFIAVGMEYTERAETDQIQTKSSK